MVRFMKQKQLPCLQNNHLSFIHGMVMSIVSMSEGFMMWLFTMASCILVLLPSFISIQTKKERKGPIPQILLAFNGLFLLSLVFLILFLQDEKTITAIPAPAYWVLIAIGVIIGIFSVRVICPKLPYICCGTFIFWIHSHFLDWNCFHRTGRDRDFDCYFPIQDGIGSNA